MGRVAWMRIVAVFMLAALLLGPSLGAQADEGGNLSAASVGTPVVSIDPPADGNASANGAVSDAGNAAGSGNASASGNAAVDGNASANGSPPAGNASATGSPSSDGNASPSDTSPTAADGNAGAGNASSGGAVGTPASAPEPPKQPTQAGVQTAATGAIVIHKLDEHGNALPGSCFLLYVDLGSGVLGAGAGHVCDTVSGSVDSDGVADGILTFSGLAAGNYVAAESSPPLNYLINDQYYPVALGAGETQTIDVTDQPGGHVVILDALDGQGNHITSGNVCASIFADLGGGQLGGLITRNCAGPQGGPFHGQVYYRGLADGDYVAVITTTPAGYVTPANQSFSVTGADRDLNVTFAASAGPSTLVVHKINGGQTLLPGACVSLYTDWGGGALGTHVASQCDFQDGQNDGVITFTDLVAGPYVLKEYHAPNGYLNGATMTVQVIDNATTTASLVDEAGGATLTITKVDATTKSVVTGACWSVYRDPGNHQIVGWEFVEGRCDNSDGSDNGITPFTGLPAGNYVLYERVAPTGYDRAENTLFTVNENYDPVNLTVEDTASGAPQYGALVIRKTDPNGNPLTGACFTLLNPQTGAAITSVPHCDGDRNDADGAADGKVTFGSVRGSFKVHEATAPDGYAAAADQTTANIAAGQTVTVTFVDQPLSGSPTPTATLTPTATPTEIPTETPVESTPAASGATSLPVTGIGPAQSSGGATLAMATMMLLMLAALRLATRRRTI